MLWPCFTTQNALYFFTTTKCAKLRTLKTVSGNQSMIRHKNFDFSIDFKRKYIPAFVSMTEMEPAILRTEDPFASIRVFRSGKKEKLGPVSLLNALNLR